MAKVCPSEAEDDFWGVLGGSPSLQGGAGGALPLGAQSSSPQGNNVLIPGGAVIRAATVSEAGEYEFFH